MPFIHRFLIYSPFVIHTKPGEEKEVSFKDLGTKNLSVIHFQKSLFEVQIQMRPLNIIASGVDVNVKCEAVLSISLGKCAVCDVIHSPACVVVVVVLCTCVWHG